MLGGVGFLLLAARLVAALAGWSMPPITAISAAQGEFLASVALVIAIVALAALISMVPMQQERLLWLRGEHGGVLVPLAALERLATAEALQHADVVKAEARLTELDGAPAGQVKVYARPLADSASVSGDVQVRVRRELHKVLGREARAVEVRITVLRVEQLKRYLP